MTSLTSQRPRLYSVALAFAGALVSLVACLMDATAGDRGGQAVASCASCHRLDGRDTGIVPIAGMDEDRIAKALLAYRSGARKNQIMQVVAQALSPGEIAAVAHELADLHGAPAR